MGSDHGPAAPYPTEGDIPRLFLSVRPGQFVVVSENPSRDVRQDHLVSGRGHLV